MRPTEEEKMAFCKAIHCEDWEEAYRIKGGNETAEQIKKKAQKIQAKKKAEREWEEGRQKYRLSGVFVGIWIFGWLAFGMYMQLAYNVPTLFIQLLVAVQFMGFVIWISIAFMSSEPKKDEQNSKANIYSPTISDKVFTTMNFSEEISNEK